MKVFVATKWNEGLSIAGVFSSREAAEATFRGDCDVEIEEYGVTESPIPPTIHIERIAEVYPDGTFEEYTRESTVRGVGQLTPCEDKEAFDGHSQSHCGEHIYISGGNRELVEEAFKRRLTESIDRQDGMCHSKFGSHTHPVDGRLIFECGGFGKTRLSRCFQDQVCQHGCPLELCCGIGLANDRRTDPNPQRNRVDDLGYGMLRGIHPVDC
jgi:hypothetical protein